MNDTISVLIVDDSKAVRAFLRQLLDAMGHRVLEAANGKEGLDLLAHESPDIILTDLEMPEMDGLAFITELRGICPHIPVIVISMKSSYPDVIEAVRRGAWDYLVKPIKGDDLDVIINRSLERVRLLEENSRYRRQLEEKVRAQTRELVESERKFKTLFESRLDGLLLADAESRQFRLCNRAITRMLGYSEEELKQLSVADIHPPADLPHVIEQFEKQVRGELEVAADLPVRRKDGTVFFADICSGLIELDGARCLLGSFRDVTDRKLAQEKLKRQMDNLTALRTIDNAINGSLDLRVTLKVLLMEALKQLDVDAAVVLLLNPFSQTLEFASEQGFRTDRISFAHVRIGENCAGRVAKEHRILFLSDIALAQEGTIPKTLVASEGFKSYVGVPLIAKGKVKGVLELFHRAPLNPEQDWLNFVEALAGQAAIAIDNAELFESLQSSNSELLSAYDTTIEGWSRALDYRDKETEGHSRRVTELTVRIAREMGISREKLVHVRRGALLHDIGKLGVPDNILLKPGKLTEEEFEIMKRHPEIAYSLLSPIEFLRPALDIPHFHHEKWDGSGYPNGLKGDEIPLTARIFAVVDVWDALSSDRPYRSAWKEKKVWEYICDQAGIHFDPGVVKLFLTQLPQVGHI